jgi:hypothetical protein
MSNRKLLVLAIAGCVAPISGAQAPALAEPIQHDDDCPYARAEMAAAQREADSGISVRWSEASSTGVSVYDASRSAPELIP